MSQEALTTHKSVNRYGMPKAMNRKGNPQQFLLRVYHTLMAKKPALAATRTGEGRCIPGEVLKKSLAALSSAPGAGRSCYAAQQEYPTK
jgi:hypothetical protein